MSYVPLRGEAVLETGGRSLALVVDNAAFLAMEREAGRSFLALVGELIVSERTGEAVRLGTLQVLLWGALRQCHPAVTVAECGDIVLADTVAVRAAVIEALAGALPKRDEDDEPGEATAPTSPAPKSGTGAKSRSGGSKPTAT